MKQHLEEHLQGVFSVLNVEQFSTDVHSQEFAVYGDDKIKLLSNHFQIGSK